MAKSSAASGEISIIRIETARLTVPIIGTTPLICNRVSEKAQRELLGPLGRKNAAHKAENLKHEPLAEYRNSPYTLPSGPTLLAGLAVWFKKAMMTAALDIPGAKKTQMGRLLYAEGERIPLYGVQQMLMAVTRSADINRTPDIRTRAIVPKWATYLTVTFPSKIIKEKSVINLLAAGGLFAGVGDWRTEKGSGNYGSFRIAEHDDPELLEIVEQGGRDAQIEAMNSPTFYDDETDSLFAWWTQYASDRGFKVAI